MPRTPPLQVPAEYYERYRDIDPASGFGDGGMPFPEMSEKDKEDAPGKCMPWFPISIDNIGKLLEKLEELEIADNTLVIFMTDNGPRRQARYVAGMRGQKRKCFSGEA